MKLPLGGIYTDFTFFFYPFKHCYFTHTTPTPLVLSLLDWHGVSTSDMVHSKSCTCNLQQLQHKFTCMESYLVITCLVLLLIKTSGIWPTFLFHWPSSLNKEPNKFITFLGFSPDNTVHFTYWPLFIKGEYWSLQHHDSHWLMVALCFVNHFINMVSSNSLQALLGHCFHPISLSNIFYYENLNFVSS